MGIISNLLKWFETLCKEHIIKVFTLFMTYNH